MATGTRKSSRDGSSRSMLQGLTLDVETRVHGMGREPQEREEYIGAPPRVRKEILSNVKECTECKKGLVEES